MDGTVSASFRVCFFFVSCGVWCVKTSSSWRNARTELEVAELDGDGEDDLSDEHEEEEEERGEAVPALVQEDAAEEGDEEIWQRGHGEEEAVARLAQVEPRVLDEVDLQGGEAVLDKVAPEGEHRDLWGSGRVSGRESIESMRAAGLE